MTLEVSRSFKPSIAATVGMLLLVTVFTNLGLWQTKRATEKAATEERHQAAPDITLEKALRAGERFASIDASGHYDGERHILLDNQVWNGRAGVYVFTPFYTLDGTAILVNRGWLPLSADRQTLPEIPTPQHQTVLRGTLNTVPVPGRILGQPDSMNRGQWPQLVTYLNLENTAGVLDTYLENWVVQLSDTEQAGFEGRHWKPVFLSSGKHKAYAFQWYALTATSVVLWILIGFKKSSGKKQ